MSLIKTKIDKLKKERAAAKKRGATAQAKAQKETDLLKSSIAEQVAVVKAKYRPAVQIAHIEINAIDSMIAELEEVEKAAN